LAQIFDIINFFPAVYVTTVIFAKLTTLLSLLEELKTRKCRWESKQPKCNV